MINRMLTILEREMDNSGRIYLYREEDKWVVYDRSALYLSQMIQGLLIFKHVVEGVFWLPKAEVDMQAVPEERVLSRTARECILEYAF